MPFYNYIEQPLAQNRFTFCVWFLTDLIFLFKNKSIQVLHVPLVTSKITY